MSTSTVILIFLGGLVLFGITLYNKLVAYRNQYKNAFAQIDVQLTRRFDLIPNLVNVAKGYMEHERGTLEAVINARNAAVNGLSNAKQNPGDETAMAELADSNNTLTGALGRLFALTENYPDLKANENMMQLSEELTTTENKVAFARQAFNDGVMIYNTQREQFPSNFIANRFNFGPAKLLEIEDIEIKKEVPQVSFD